MFNWFEITIYRIWIISEIKSNEITYFQSKITNYFIGILIEKLKEENEIDVIDKSDSNLYVNYDEVIILIQIGGIIIIEIGIGIHVDQMIVVIVIGEEEGDV